ncbi:MAG: ABC transporter ATP-binding protein [Burkholderiales bacterium]|nr:ABC transporter ATP-binding protein [Opitutaceae bacterium]
MKPTPPTSSAPRAEPDPLTSLDPRHQLTVVTRRREEAEEEAAQRPLEWGIIRRLWGYAGVLRAKRNALVALTIIRSIQLPALTWILSAAIAGPVADHDTRLLLWMAAAYAGLAIVTEGMFHFRMRYAQELGETVVHRLRVELFANIQRQPMAFFHRTKLGRVLGRVTSDVEALRTAIQDVFFVSIVQFGQMAVAAGLMLWLDPVMFLVVLGLAPVIWKLNLHFRDRISRQARATTESFSRVTATLVESVNGIRVTQGFVRENLNAGFFRSLLADHSKHNTNLARSSAILQPMLELNSQFFIAALLLLGGWRVFEGHMEAAEVIKFFFFAGLFFHPLTVIGNQYNQALVAMAGAERVFRLIDLKPDWQDAPDATELPRPTGAAQGAASEEPGAMPTEKPSASTTAQSGASASGSPLPAPRSPLQGLRVEFDQVTFSYEPGRPVLRDVSFVAEPGQTVALVGHTGSGKSSIINLATKFYLADSGAVRLDDRDVRTLTGKSIHRQLGLVTQQNFLFGGTVLDNLRFARPEASEAEVRAAAAELDCLDIFDSLPRGLHTEVGERGASLSLGQRQLVCFTRAFLADPRLVILDEATSSIDALTEARLQTALAKLVHGRTSLVVAHRLSTIRRADLILVLDQGRIVERGTHDSLVSGSGPYARLHAQFASGGAPHA